MFPHLNLPLKKGVIYPVVAYTNCPTVELLVDGVSYGVKAYEFPNQGMTKEWPHFDHPLSPITTNDLHLAWDVPSGANEIVAIGRDLEGNEIARQVIRPVGEAVSLCVAADVPSVTADGRSVVQLEMALLDASSQVVPDGDRPIRLQVEGGELLGMDNGLQSDHALYRAGERSTFHGMAYAVIRAPREKGCIRVTASCKGLPPVTVEIPAE